MQSFTRLADLIGLVPADVVRLLRRIDVGAGSEGLYANQLPGLLDELATRARVQSVTASSAIEGVVVEPSRAWRIIAGQVQHLSSRSEQELAGYRDALDYVYREDPGPVTVGLVLHLHRLLFAHTQADGGRFKAEDNLVVDVGPDGTRSTRFKPVSARETPFHVEELTARYADAVSGAGHHPVLLVGVFALDLSVIHPFEDGNGRVMRVLNNYLLDQQGYGVTRYVSLEQLVHDDRDTYYDALAASTKGWFEAAHDPWPWLRFLLGKLVVAYDRFEDHAAAVRPSGTKQDRVREHVLRYAGSSFSMDELRQSLPGISDQTIRLVLASLRTEGAITALGTGRGTRWRRR